MNLLRLHRNYLFSKINIIIITILLIISVILGITIVKPFNSASIRWMNRISISENYEHSYIMFTKIIMVMFASYLFGISFSKTGDNYSIILTCRISKSKYFISKIIILCSIILMMSLLLLLSYLLIGIIFNSWFIISVDILKHFVEIFFLSLSYGFLSLFVIRRINSTYLIIIPFGLYLISELLLEYDATITFVKIIDIFFPTTYTSKNGITLLYGIYHVILLDVLYMILGYFSYLKKE